MTRELKINSLADLDRERVLLRDKIAHKELILHDHYTALSAQLKPAMRVVNFISGNRIFKGLNNKDGGNADWLSTLFKLLMAGTAGGFILNRSRKNLFKTLLAYGLDQGIKFIQEKDLNEHIENIKQWFSKYKKETEEEDEDS